MFKNQNQRKSSKTGKNTEQADFFWLFYLQELKMRKRINSEEKYDYAGLPTLTIDLRKQSFPENQSFREYCPPPRPKPQSLDKSKYSTFFGKDLPAPKVREFPNPLMKELRRLILNQIDSGDRLYHYLSSSTHKNLLNLYRDDRKTLIEYLNTLIIRETRLDSIRVDLDKKLLRNNPECPVMDNTLDSVEKANDSKQTVRKRSFSEQKETHIYNNQINDVKKRLKKLEKGCKNCPYHHKKANKPQIPKPRQSKNKGIQKSDQILQSIKKQLQKAIVENQCKQNFLLIEKEEVQKIIQNISDAITENNTKMEKINKQIEKQRKSKEKLKNEIQQLRLNPEAISQSCKELRSSRVQENSDDQYCELKAKVNRLYDELAQLVIEVEQKDEVIQYLKMQNENLRNNMVELQDLIRTIKSQQRTLTDYVESLEQKTRYLEDEIASKETEIIQIRVENYQKEKQITNLTIESQKSLAKAEDKNDQKLIELTNKLIKLENEKQLMKVEKQILQNNCNEKEHSIKKLKEQIAELQAIVENVKHEKSILKINHENLKSYLENVKQQNIKLHSTIQMQQKMNSQIQLKQDSNSQHQRNFSNEVNQSFSKSQDIFQQHILTDNIVEHKVKTLSETGEEINKTLPLKKQFSEAEGNFNMMKKRSLKQTLQEVENQYISDNSARISNIHQSSDKIVEKSDNLEEDIHVRVIKEVRSEQDKESIERVSSSIDKASNQNQFQNYENYFNRMLQVEEKNEEKQALKRSNSKDLPHVVLSETIDKAAQGKGQIQVKNSDNNIQEQFILNPVGRTTVNPSSNGSVNRINRNIFIKWGSKEPMTPAPRSQRTQSCNNLK